MIAINPYLNFAGNTEEAFTFYKSIFGGDFAMVMRFDGSPGCENMSPEDKQKIMHIALPVKGNMIMGTDAMRSMGQQLVTGNNFIWCWEPKAKKSLTNFILSFLQAVRLL